MTFPSYPPTWLEWEPNTPYYIPGWTVQHPIQIDTVETRPIPGLPDDIPIIEVTGNYVNLRGFAYEGIVRFRSTVTERDAESQTRVLPGEIKGHIHNGVLSANLPAGFTYTVHECIPGGRRFTLEIPSDTDSPVNIDDLIAGVTSSG